jgi:glycosyltransferase involved in cell wall biosynthesis
MPYDLSFIIPSRHEEFLSGTVERILQNIRGNSEVIVILDGVWSDPPLIPDERLTVIYYPESIGQRAACNQGVKLSRAKYVAKIDAHCTIDEGFDVKMLDAFKETGDNVVMTATMRNLWMYDWKCGKCGLRVYQDKESICPPNKRHSESVQMYKKMLWIAKTNPQSTAFCFDPEPHFQYDGGQKRRQVGDIVESMSLQGSFFMTSREKYLELDICNEDFGSWGSSGIEISCKFWLSGGRVLVNRKTWYAHMFRTKPLFSFPYELSGRQVQRAKKMVKDLFFNNKWPKAIHPLSWLVEKFLPIPGWTPEEITKLKEMENLQTK